jgi:hypothetical protein
MKADENRCADYPSLSLWDSATENIFAMCVSAQTAVQLGG